MNILRLVCSIVVMFVSICQCQNDPAEAHNKINLKKYCGENLSKTLSTVCKGNYNTLTKKIDVVEKRGHWSPIFGPAQEEPWSPFQRKARAISMMKFGQRRKKRGVFNECCQKACSHRELQNYCAH